MNENERYAFLYDIAKLLVRCEIFMYEMWRTNECKNTDVEYTQFQKQHNYLWHLHLLAAAGCFNYDKLSMNEIKLKNMFNELTSIKKNKGE